MSTSHSGRALEMVVELERVRTSLHNDAMLASCESPVRELNEAIDALTRFAGHERLRESRTVLLDRVESRERLLEAVQRMGMR